MKVCVTGAYGWIGRNVTRFLENLEIEVLRVDLRVPGGGLAWDCSVASDARQFVDSLKGSLAVIHCVGHVHRPKENREEVRRFRAVNVDGTQRLLTICQAAGVSRVVYIGTLAVYDWKEPGPKSECSRTSCNTAYARSKYDGEAILKASQFDWRVVRLGTVFGRDDRANFSRVARALKTGRFVIPGRGEARKSVICVDDAATILCRIALDDNPKHRLCNVANPEAPSLTEICNSLAAACGFARPRHIPVALFRLAALAGDLVAKFRPSFPLTTTNLKKLTTSTVVDTTRMTECFPDFKWKPFSEQIAQCADYYASLS